MAVSYVVTACVLSWVLYSLFYIRKHFDMTWYRQMYLAALLATSPMAGHWIAQLGASYTYSVKDLGHIQRQRLVKDAFAAGIGIVVCFVLFFTFLVLYFGFRGLFILTLGWF